MTIGEKLRYFGVSKFGNITKFADALDMKLPSLYPYLKDESIPGGLFLQTLKNFGCDINWLLTVDDSPMPAAISFIRGFGLGLSQDLSSSSSMVSYKLSEAELALIIKLRQVPSAKAIIEKFLDGQIKVKEALTELSNFDIKVNNSSTSPASK